MNCELYLRSVSFRVFLNASHVDIVWGRGASDLKKDVMGQSMGHLWGFLLWITFIIAQKSETEKPETLVSLGFFLYEENKRKKGGAQKRT